MTPKQYCKAMPFVLEADAAKHTNELSGIHISITATQAHMIVDHSLSHTQFYAKVFSQLSCSIPSHLNPHVVACELFALEFVHR